MKVSTFILTIFGLLIGPNPNFAQTLFGSWKFESSKVLQSGDTTSLFERDGTNNTFDLTQASYTFIPDGTYTASSIDGTPFEGIWSQSGNTISIDNKTANFTSLNDSTFLINSQFISLDTLGNQVPATSLLQFYSTSRSAQIPTLSEWGSIILLSLLLIYGVTKVTKIA